MSNPQKFCQHEIPKILGKLQYELTHPESYFQTPHNITSWPHMLEAMKWMTERAKYVLDLMDRAADHMFPEDDKDANIKMVTTLS